MVRSVACPRTSFQQCDFEKIADFRFVISKLLIERFGSEKGKFRTALRLKESVFLSRPAEDIDFVDSKKLAPDHFSGFFEVENDRFPLFD